MKSPKRIVLRIVFFLVIGAFIGWELREVKDAKSGNVITNFHGPIPPWKPCGVSGKGSSPVNFHVQQWFCYGLLSLSAQGTTY
ncbi:MAG TPA: hypothetical protein VLT36_24135 [Candidatus Dormibacteraeota bacterium]|nr:hypothetical protein [Candidatus Dormibacteraeota bacterium]